VGERISNATPAQSPAVKHLQQTSTSKNNFITQIKSTAMKFLSFRYMIPTAFLSLSFLLNSCDSRYRPRTVPDSDPPKIAVKITGGGLLLPVYTIHGMGITPDPPAITPSFRPGTVYRATVTAGDIVGLYNLRIGLNKDFFDLSDINAIPGTVTTSEAGSSTLIDVTLPISPAKTGTILTFAFTPKPMPQGTIAPLLGMNVIATDFGEAGRSSNVSGYTIPIAYVSE
jgi:hypothetical protein